MNRATKKSLGGFEQRLLQELREVVADGAAPAAILDERPLRGGRSVKRRWPLAVAAGLAAVFAALLLAVWPFGGNDDGRAWAVTTNNDGTVTVEIDSLRDADGLQRELRRAGVPTVVQYVPPRKACAGQTPSHASVTAPGLHGAGDHARATESMRRGRQGVQITTKPNGGIEFTFDAAAHPGETLLIRSQGLALGQAPAAHPAATNGGTAINVSHVSGEVPPCRLIDSPTQ
jgi:hypothetical protein